MNDVFWINSRRDAADVIFENKLRYLLSVVNPTGKPVAFTCIGSSHVCGDNLGPIIGTVLDKAHYPHVYGTLSAPLNALTLPSRISVLRKIEQSYCVIAIDASLGKHSEAGYITLSHSCLYPGSALHKALPPVGHLHITGVFDSLNTKKAQDLLPILSRKISLGLLHTMTS